jgi:hypothetical protein
MIKVTWWNVEEIATIAINEMFGHGCKLGQIFIIFNPLT